MVTQDDDCLSVICVLGEEWSGTHIVVRREAIVGETSVLLVWCVEDYEVGSEGPYCLRIPSVGQSVLRMCVVSGSYRAGAGCCSTIAVTVHTHNKEDMIQLITKSAISRVSEVVLASAQSTSLLQLRDRRRGAQSGLGGCPGDYTSDLKGETSRLWKGSRLKTDHFSTLKSTYLI